MNKLEMQCHVPLSDMSKLEIKCRVPLSDMNKLKMECGVRLSDISVTLALFCSFISDNSTIGNVQ